MCVMQDMGWFDHSDNSSGEVMSRMSTDISAIKGAVCDALGATLQNLSTLVIGAAICFSAT